MDSDIRLLGDFFKHCLNIGYNVRPNQTNSKKCLGWQGCKIVPYLINNQVYHKNKYSYTNLVENQYNSNHPNLEENQINNDTTIYNPSNINGGIYHGSMNDFKDCLLYTLLDYKQFIRYYQKDNFEVIKYKINNLINFINHLSNQELIDKINLNFQYFPTPSIISMENVIKENFNTLLKKKNYNIIYPIYDNFIVD